MGTYNFEQQKHMKGTDSWKWDKEGKECPWAWRIQIFCRRPR
jgi:cystathionine beta-lyase